jgi:hypothetical protein
MPAFAMTMSQLLHGEFAIAASNTRTCSSQLVMLHFTNCAFLHAVSGGRFSCQLRGRASCYARPELLGDFLPALFIDVGDGYKCPAGVSGAC